MDKRTVPPIGRDKRYFVRTKDISTSVRSLTYDSGAHTLEVEYASGPSYLYFDVLPEEFVALLTAESMGGYINRQFKAAHPRFKKL